jgi:hypothetical protein
MIAFYVVGTSMKILRNALIVDLTDSIVGKMAVMTTIATEERAGLKRYFGTFLSFLIWSVGLQTKRSQKCSNGIRRSISRMPEWEGILLMPHSGEILIHEILNLQKIPEILVL